LFPHLTVRQNLPFARWFAPRCAAPSVRFNDIVQMLGVGCLLGRRPGRLSGRKGRVAIGRALLTEPRLSLTDEPLASLDMVRKDEILSYLERLRDASVIADGWGKAVGPVVDLTGRAGQITTCR
jgi:molybdate transport system ATP-binding protein